MKPTKQSSDSDFGSNCNLKLKKRNNNPILDSFLAGLDETIGSEDKKRKSIDSAKKTLKNVAPPKSRKRPTVITETDQFIR
jgi:hypothetical protein